VHCFRHAIPDTWFLMAATLSAGLSLRWWRDTLGLPTEGAYETLDKEAERAGVGAGGLLFLPYLLGERTPYMDAGARGAFVGLSLEHGRGHLSRAVMEGVALSLRQGLDIMAALTTRPEALVASGGGAKSRLWRQIQADVLGVPLRTVQGEERAVVGAAMLAGLGVGVYRSFGEARETCVRYGDTINPAPGCRLVYDQLLDAFESVYPGLRPAYELLARVRAAGAQVGKQHPEASSGS
jgi:xylulokinase